MDIHDNLIQSTRDRDEMIDAAKKNARVEREKHLSKKPVLWDLLDHGDHRLWLETFWFLLINAVTGYMFLYKGFTWPQEPGRIQRFMW